MHKISNRLFTIVICIIITCISTLSVTAENSTAGVSSQAGNDIIRVHEDNMTMTVVGAVPIFETDGTIRIPIKSFAYHIKYAVVNENADKSLTISNGNRTIKIATNDKLAQIDDSNVELTNYVTYNESDFYVTLTDAALLFSYGVTYDKSSGLIHLYETEDTPKAVKTSVTPSPDMFNNENVKSVTVRCDKSRKNLAVSVDGNLVEFPDVQPFIDDDGRTQIPVRALSEMLNCKVEWNQSQQLVTVTGDNGTIITLTIGDNKLYINDSVIVMDTTAMIVENRTYIPVRYLVEALGLNVYWEYEE